VLDPDGSGGGQPLVPHLLALLLPVWVPHLLPVWLLDREPGLLPFLLGVPYPAEPGGVSPRGRQGVELDRLAEGVPIEEVSQGKGSLVRKLLLPGKAMAKDISPPRPRSQLGAASELGSGT